MDRQSSKRDREVKAVGDHRARMACTAFVRLYPSRAKLAADFLKTNSHDYQGSAEETELAPAFVFLASQDSSYITGEVLGVTGGRPLA